MLSVDLTVPALQSLKVVNIQPGPDGYIFENSSRRYRGNLMTELFSSNYYHYTGAGLLKKGRFVPIMGTKENQYRYRSWNTSASSPQLRHSYVKGERGQRDVLAAFPIA